MSVKPNLVEFTPFIPKDSIPHAGGEYVRRHLTALSDSYQVTVVGPGTAENQIAALMVEPKSAKVILIPGLSKLQEKISTPIRLLYKAIRGASLGIDTEFRLKRDKAVLQALREADAIGFQWTEAATLSRFARGVAPNARQTLVIHDVLAQRWRRASLKSRNVATKVFYYLRYVSALHAEKKAFASVDTVVAFSEKDATLARGIQPLANVVVINPPLIDEAMPTQAASLGSTVMPRSVLFTGALNRTENHEAVMWFLSEIWPSVATAVPDARFVIAGASPRQELLDLAEQFASVEVTGFVDDLNACYKTAGLFVAPLRAGAGVKFKTITAMLWGLPIVSTDIGAEGIGDSQLFVAVTNDPVEFRAAIIKFLNDPSSVHSIVRRSFEWAHSQYSTEAFRSSLESITNFERR